MNDPTPHQSDELDAILKTHRKKLQQIDLNFAKGITNKILHDGTEEHLLREAKAAIEALIEHEKQQLLERVRTEVIGPDEAKLEMRVNEGPSDWRNRVSIDERNKFRTDQRQRLASFTKSKEDV